MKKKLKLATPIIINGKPIDSFDYDVDEISGELFMEAEIQQKSATNYKGGMSPMEFNTGLHLYLGMAAIIALDSKVDWSDLLRIKGKDIVKIVAIGRTFITGSEGDSQASSSDEPTETSPESTTQA